MRSEENHNDKCQHALGRSSWWRVAGHLHLSIGVIWSTCCLIAILNGPSLLGQTLTSSQVAALTLLPSGAITSLPSSLTLVSNGTAYVGSIVISNEIRTTGTGSGQLGVQVTTDFSPNTGPKAASGNLLYTCTSTSYGTACSGSTQASTSAQTAIITFAALSCTGGGTPCSSSDPNTATVQFSITDSAVFKTGSYSAVVTFTISAT